VEHPAGSQQPIVGKSSRAVEERARCSDVTNQHATKEQHDEEIVPAAEEPTAASSGIMGFVLVDRSGTENPAAEAPAGEAVAVEEEPEIEEIVHPKEENMAPQCIRVARMRGCEWVFHEEDHSDRAICKLQSTVDDLMSQIKVRALEALCILVGCCRDCYH
jgi:hypothetical protein